MPGPTTTRQRLIVGVDFGTTNSGVSWTTPGRGEAGTIECIKQWPGAGNNNRYEKCPSRVAYVNEQTGHSGPVPAKNVLWGYEVDPGMKSYSWMKLLLDREALSVVYRHADHLSSSVAGAMQLPAGKTAETVVTDFLRELYNHSMEEIGKEVGVELLRQTPIDFWFTMPAIWSDHAQDVTKRAARSAGFGSRSDDTISMISEPEAAAIATLKSQSDGLDGSLQEGDGVLICDCGGGTVDITTYTIGRTAPSLAFNEICVGTGAACGSTAIDRNLLRLMERRFGQAFTSLPPAKYAPGSKFMRDLEVIKSKFGSSNSSSSRAINSRITLKLRGVEDSQYYDTSEDDVILSYYDLQGIFDPVVNQIIGLVREQILEVSRQVEGQTIQTIFLVGGFGESGYLYSKMKDVCDQAGIALKRPQNAWSAIVRGAAIRGLQGSVVRRRKCRRHYGISISKPFDPRTDNEGDAYTCAFSGKRFVTGYIAWLVNKGDDIPPNLVRSFGYYHDYTEGGNSVQRIPLWACTLDEAPNKANHERVEQIGELRYDISSFDLSGFSPKNDSDNSRVYLLDYNIDIILGDDEGTLKVRTSALEREWGVVEVNYARRQAREHCPICFSDFGEDVTTTACNHKFCAPCIQAVTGSSPTPRCPICRSGLQNTASSGDSRPFPLR